MDFPCLWDWKHSCVAKHARKTSLKSKSQSLHLHMQIHHLRLVLAPHQKENTHHYSCPQRTQWMTHNQTPAVSHVSNSHVCSSFMPPEVHWAYMCAPRPSGSISLALLTPFLMCHFLTLLSSKVIWMPVITVELPQKQ